MEHKLLNKPKDFFIYLILACVNAYGTIILNSSGSVFLLSCFCYLPFPLSCCFLFFCFSVMCLAESYCRRRRQMRHLRNDFLFVILDSLGVKFLSIKNQEIL